MFEFEEWVLTALEDVISILAPTPSRGARKAITLQDYFDPPTFAFKLVNQNGKLSDTKEIYDHQHQGDTSPRTQIWTLYRSLNLNETTVPGIRDMSCAPLSQDADLSDIPREVQQVGTDEVLLFKGGFRNHGHLRKIDILFKIEASRNFTPPFRTSKLVGLVVWDDDENPLMGLLLEFIERKSLYTRSTMESTTNKDKIVLTGKDDG
ncbi:hypothetical protein F4679DRAFT_583995 [Xylaria curta]|nr:hypothetical protein F4679DRAFT_583995 [Xylaria curta]